jgi:hypothetical protein
MASVFYHYILTLLLDVVGYNTFGRVPTFKFFNLRMESLTRDNDSWDFNFKLSRGKFITEGIHPRVNNPHSFDVAFLKLGSSVASSHPSKRVAP